MSDWYIEDIIGFIHALKFVAAATAKDPLIVTAIILEDPA